MDQSRIVTEQELEKLRSFCASPKCNSWSVIPRLSTPQRFAEFVNGSPHVSSDEVIQYSHAIDDDMLRKCPEINFFVCETVLRHLS